MKSVISPSPLPNPLTCTHTPPAPPQKNNKNKKKGVEELMISGKKYKYMQCRKVGKYFDITCQINLYLQKKFTHQVLLLFYSLREEKKLL